MKEFAKCSNKLFTLEIIRTDCFTGEIGEFIASRYFKLDLADRSTKAYDAVCSKGYKYQIKSKGKTIKVSPEQVLEQMDIDYNDLRDYLGDELR